MFYMDKAGTPADSTGLPIAIRGISARPPADIGKITLIFGVGERGQRPHLVDAVVEDWSQLLTAALGRAPRRRESPVEEDATRIVVD
jgi:hypothetical protein